MKTSKKRSRHQTLRQVISAGIFAAGIACPSIAVRADSPGVAGPLRADGHSIAVDPDIPHYVPGAILAGDLHLVGGGGIGPDVEELMAGWAAIFQKAHPMVTIHRAIYTSGCAPSTLVEERAQVGIMTRDMWPFEFTLYTNKVYKPLEFVSAGAAYNTPGFSKHQCVYVHVENPLARLSLDQVDAIYSKTRKRGYREDITTWGQLGLTGDWADKPIHLFGNIKQPDGNPYYFQLKVLLGGDWKDGLRPLKDPNSMAEDRYAIGFGPANHAGGRDKLGLYQPGEFRNVRSVDLGETQSGPFYDDSYENVLKRTYPLSRYTSLLVNQYPDKSINPLAREFLRVALSYEGQQVVARSIFLPLPASTVRDSLAKLQ